MLLSVLPWQLEDDVKRRAFLKSAAAGGAVLATADVLEQLIRDELKPRPEQTDDPWIERLGGTLP